jgi:acylphosphatase
MNRHRYRIEGRVQGVGFRWWTAREARATGIRGTVRNLPDGAVEVEAAGDDASLALFLAALAHGPSGARVDALIELTPRTSPLPAGFDIVH